MYGFGGVNNICMIMTSMSMKWLYVLQHCKNGTKNGYKCPRNRGTLYYDYKNFSSIVLMALVYTDVTNTQVFSSSELKDAIDTICPIPYLVMMFLPRVHESILPKNYIHVSITEKEL